MHAMKARTLITSLGAITLLGACATTPPPERKATSNIDHTYVNTVDHHAARMGARVYWVNPPRRKDHQEEHNGF
jgi:hypothetical protein